jgi:hypothetical protein
MSRVLTPVSPILACRRVTAQDDPHLSHLFVPGGTSSTSYISTLAKLHCSTASLRRVAPVIDPEGGDEEFDVSYISDVCINSIPGRRGKYLLFMTYFCDDDIPIVWHRLNEVYHTSALQDSWGRPNGTRLPKLMRSSTSCTLT